MQRQRKGGKNWCNSNHANKERIPNSTQDAHALLNFQYAPMRGSVSSNGGFQQPSVTRRKRNNTFNKEVFLQANCHFVVQDSGDYSVNAVDPDILVDWVQVELVYMPTHDDVQCPICLYPPSSAKMTRCGHVFCWKCILRYLSYSDKAWRKCPICHEAVHPDALKSVVLCQKKKFERNTTVTLRLMKRAKNSIQAHPAKDWKDGERETGFAKWNGDSSFQLGCSGKLMLASGDSVLQHILQTERTSLEAQRVEAIADSTGEECFIDAALIVIQERESVFRKSAKQFGEGAQLLSPEPVEAAAVAPKERPADNNRHLIAHILENDLSHAIADPFFSDDEDADEANAVGELAITPTTTISSVDQSVTNNNGFVDESDRHTVESSRVTVESESYEQGAFTRSKSTSTGVDSDHYYFYQANDGQHIYLHPLNARCLIEEYGSLENSPHQITGQIIDFESFAMKQLLRKRFRYLGHLPLACEFTICELMLRPPVLSRSTVRYFMPEFKKRKAGRDKKQEEMRKFERKAREANSKFDGFPVYYDDIPDIGIDLQDQQDFPNSFSPSSNDELSPHDDTNSQQGATAPIQWGPSRDAQLSASQQEASAVESYAHAAELFPSLGEQSATAVVPVPDTLPVKPYLNARKVPSGGITMKPWSSVSKKTDTSSSGMLVSGRSSSARAAGHSSDEEEGEKVPDFRNMFMNAMSFTGGNDSSGVPSSNNFATGAAEPSNKKKQGKKQGKKGTVLFATGGMRKY